MSIILYLKGFVMNKHCIRCTCQKHAFLNLYFVKSFKHTHDFEKSKTVFNFFVIEKCWFR